MEDCSVLSCEPVFKDRERARQLIIFGGINFNGKIPSDIDGIFEWRGKVFIFYEMKHNDYPMSVGQERMYKSLVDLINKAGKHAILFKCSHNVDDTEKDVDAAKSIVTYIYFGNRKMARGDGRTAKQMTVDYLKHVLGDKFAELMK